ncbi:hypothetical protein CQA66_04700 [Helicobacter aurati]|uniref:Outer membrane beta-barrel protein n=1 Tax=Helicobacter aurati TaxID=137778 RepID=A0A3D8J600_9HELI|nr:hypothetical protein [Helicobacter aurati]RDU72605.1 hypothetical protein CQA66_04700 [Helicobacter aurati]
MKKLIITLLTFTSLQLIYAKDVSSKIFLVYAGGGVTGGILPGELQQTTIPNYPATITPNGNPAVALDNRLLCTEATCNLNGFGGGVNLEAGIKVRPIKIIEFDLYGNLMWLYVIDQKIPNAIQLRETGINEDYIYKEPGLWNYAGAATLNADVTLRIGTIGLIGGVGISVWGRNYNVILRNEGIFNREETKEKNVDYINTAFHINAGASYRHEDMEFVMRFTMPLHTKIHYAQGNNGIADYNENLKFKYYTLSLVTRKYF